MFRAVWISSYISKGERRCRKSLVGVLLDAGMDRCAVDRRLRKGNAQKEILAASLLEAPITVRANLERITPEALAERFKEEGVTAVPLDTEKYPGLSYAYTIFGFDHLNGLSSFKEGLFYVQDISSMMVAEYAAPKEGDHCIDVCAAPGGKSIHLAEKLRGTGHVRHGTSANRKWR